MRTPLSIPVMSKKRRAVAMIELIFAIVVMGLVLMSVPEITRQSVKNTYLAYQQEAITILSSHIQTIMSLEWDEENNQSVGYPILQTSSPHIPSCTTSYPPGTSDAEGRYCEDVNGSHRSASTSLGSLNDKDKYGFDDIDDYDGKITTATLYGGEITTVEQGEYIDYDKNTDPNNSMVTIFTEVSYGDDAPRSATGAISSFGPITTFSNLFNYQLSDSDTRNIKLISVHLTMKASNPAEELDKNIILSAFMCNIGAPKKYYGQFK